MRLVFVVTGACPVALIRTQSSKGWQPAFAPDGPQLIGWLKLVWRIERTKVDANLIAEDTKDGRAAARAEMPPLIDLCLPADRYRRSRKDGRAMKQRAVVLAAIKAMAEANAMGLARDDKANIAA